MPPQRHRTARIVSVIAAALISLACGTNYAYSAWAPQFAQKLELSSTQSNIIGVAGNFGMYLSGIPMGAMIDAWGVRSGAGLGVVLLAAGYFAIRVAYDRGAGSMSVPALCFFMILTGLGSTAASMAGIKTCAVNFPDSRGTATAFPMAAFGLSALFFSSLSALVFPNDTSALLLVFATGTSSLVAVSFSFVRIFPTSPYKSISTHETPNPSDSHKLVRSRSSKSANERSATLRGAHDSVIRPPSIASKDDLSDNLNIEMVSNDPSIDEAETTSVMSDSSASAPGDVPYRTEDGSHSHDGVQQLDITGRALLKYPEFWQLSLMLGLLCGIGLMTINNIGNNVRALWRRYDESASQSFVQGWQAMHVSILSFGSFCGRLFSGIGSDFIVKKLNGSRIWCLFTSALLLCVSQLSAAMIETPHYLGFVSGLTGFAYGMLFGVYPSIVANTFGTNGMSQNWGMMMLGIVFVAQFFNVIYGKVYDSHSFETSNGRMECSDGRHCYSSAYWVTFAATFMGIALSLWSIRYESWVHKANKKSRRFNHHRDA